jgi:hypothetical protein
MSSITIELPDQIAQRLQDSGWHDLPRHVLESVALESYRQEKLTSSQSGSILGMSFWEKEVFLKKHDAYLHYDVNDFLQDMETNKLSMEKREKEKQEKPGEAL